MKEGLKEIEKKKTLELINWSNKNAIDVKWAYK